MTTRYFSFFFISLFGISCLLLSCGKDDDDNESSDPIVLSYGPSPALRGGELKFIGKNLMRVSSITLPNNIAITNFTSKSNEVITLVVPEETVDGVVQVTSDLGVQSMKTLLTISEPIKFIDFSPKQARPGDKITITGDYLNLIKEVIFPNKKVQKTFSSQAKDKLELTIPTDAQSGKILLSNGMENPILVEAIDSINITVGKISSISPNPIKAGTTLTIEGTDLDLVTALSFGGGIKVSNFVSTSATKVEVQVPANAKDGKLTVEMASLATTESTEILTLKVPEITSISPNPGKNGKTLTIAGKDVDLVSSVTFANNKTGSIVMQSETSLTVSIPLDASVGPVNLQTNAGKNVQTESLQLALPTLNTISPSSSQSSKPITISGSNLDLVIMVLFNGGKSVNVTNANETELSVTIPSGSTSGPISVITTNGSQITSTSSLEILASNVPEVIGYPSKAKPGELITLTGNKMSLVTDIIFPGNAYATTFGIKTETLIEVVVPLSVQKGYGRIKFMTNQNEVAETELINFVGVDNVQDESLVFFDFNGSGAKDAWWGNVKITNDNNNVDGTSYGLVEGNYNGWTDLFWRNGLNNFPGNIIGNNVNDYVVKFDINLVKPITAGNLKFRLHGAEGDFWWTWGPAGVNGSEASTSGWETITVPISAFKDNNGFGTNSPSTMATIDQEFGMAFADGAADVLFYVDNVRFERK